MKALSVQEIDALATSLKPLLGSRLQEAVVATTGVGLGFWTGTRNQGLVWLWFEDHHWSPLLLPLNQIPEAPVKPIKPLALFLRAHFIGHPLRHIERDAQLGRALVLDFGVEESVPRRIEVHLWPHGGNFQAQMENRRVSLKRSTPLTTPPQVMEEKARDLSLIMEEWIALRDQRQDRGAKAKAGAGVSVEKKIKAEVARLQRAIKKVNEEIELKSTQPFRDVGNWMVREQSLDVPSEWKGFVDKRRTLSWNIENCFGQAKELERKLESTLKRREDLLGQLAAIEEKPPEEAILKTTPTKKSKREDKDKKARFRTITLPGGFIARIGRSAQDNANLLKAANGWDIWLHLRDYPGAHAIISREKKKNVGDDVIRGVGVALVEQTFGRKACEHVGERFELIVTECRFVRSIKGKQRGLVTYSHERTVGFRHS